MAADIVTRTINIAAQAATMAAEFIVGARSSEGALLCEAGLQYVGGARMSAIVVIVVVDADGNTTEGADGACVTGNGTSEALSQGAPPVLDCGPEQPNFLARCLLRTENR